ncbi:hypothetical protein [Secundilactobacillus paracollinoides]|nr:hypothetical protein [Secundilactobacillus paracollinoides]
MADHTFDDHSASVASTTILKALNDAASTKDLIRTQKNSSPLHSLQY